MALVIKSECIDIKDGVCATVCPVDCIYEGERIFYIHPTECIECGMCESICPVDAIRYDDDPGAEIARFNAISRAVFDDGEGGLREPGGWSRSSPPVNDHPLVRNWPTKSEKENQS